MPSLPRSSRPSAPQRRPRRRVAPAFGAAFGLLVFLALPPVAGAELVVLDDGRYFKVSGYEVVDGDRARLSLREGGRVTLPLGRVAHVVDDEWMPPEPEPEVQDTAAARSWRFAEGHPVPDVPHGEAIYRAARLHGVAPELVAAVVRAESAFDVRAVSGKGARGLMQLMPATARRFGVPEERIFEPTANVDAGTRYLAWLLERFDGELALALAAYNAGEGTVDRYGGVPPFRETRSYIRRIYATLGLAQPGQIATKL